MQISKNSIDQEIENLLTAEAKIKNFKTDHKEIFSELAKLEKEKTSASENIKSFLLLVPENSFLFKKVRFYLEQKLQNFTANYLKREQVI